MGRLTKMGAREIGRLFKYHFNLFKTICFNLKAFSFKDAIKMPVLLFGNVALEDIHRGCIQLSVIKPDVLRIGGGRYTEMWGYSNLAKSYFRCAGTLVVGENVIIDQGCVISICKDAVLTLGSNIYMNRGVKIHAKESILIEDDSMVGWSCQIMDSNFHYCVHKGVISKRTAPVVLKHNVWLANSVTIGKGVYLPPYFIVAAHSFVNKDFREYEERCLIGGIPAKYITNDITCLLNVERKLDAVFAEGKDAINVDEVNIRIP